MWVRGVRRSDVNPSSRARRMMLGIFLLGSVGTLGELILLGHYEEAWQLAPLIVLAVSLAVATLWHLAGRRTLLRIFQLSMLLCLVTGITGVTLHYRSNLEFELEMYPSAGGWSLVWESLTGAMPALAPGSMIQLGLLGLLYTYQHPAFRPRPEDDVFPGGP